MTAKNMFPPGLKTTSLLVVPGCCVLTPLYPFTPASFWNPHYIKTCLISALPSPSSAPDSCVLNEPPRPTSSPLVLSPCTGCRALCMERASSELDYISSYFTNTQYAWPLGLHESPQLSPYVIICDPIYMYSGSTLWDLFTSCMRIKWSSGA